VIFQSSASRIRSSSWRLRCSLRAAAAWVFVAFRVLHGAVHCTFNRVMLRFYLYLIATLAVWFMIVRAALTYLGG
jgi:hypothetical protein